MAFGVTDDGFVIKRLSDIKTELENSHRSVFGNGINLAPNQPLGQLIGIYSEREALIWEGKEAVYKSQYPETSSGVNLDYVASITGIERLRATFSTVVVYATGNLGTIIPADSIISVAGNPEIRFLTTESETIGVGTDEVQTITFSSVPDAGNWTLIFDGEETSTLAWNSTNTDVQNALNGLSALSGVTVTGNFNSGFVVTFTSGDGQQPQSLIQEGNTNTLEVSSTPITISIAETTPGQFPNVDIFCQAEEAGSVEAPAGTLTVIETVVAGWNAVTNNLDADVGRDVETDAELRVRRLETLSIPGAGTVDAIRAKLLTIDEVEAALVYENDENFVVAGRPPKSVECVVLEGDEDEIAQAIWDKKPVGIETFGSVTRVVTDSQGFDHNVNFSRPTEIDIYLQVDIVKGPTYPTGGDDAIKAAVIDYADQNFGIGQEVVTTELYCPIHTVEGILSIVLRIATSSIVLIQRLQVDSDFVSGNVINLDIAGNPITPVSYNTSHANTLLLLSTAIQSDSRINTAVVTGAREITVTSNFVALPGVMHDFIVTGGASQPQADIDTLSHSDANIPIDDDEISSWDTSRIIVTDIT